MGFIEPLVLLATACFMAAVYVYTVWIERRETAAAPVPNRYPVPSHEELIRMMPMHEMTSMSIRGGMGSRQISERLQIPENWVVTRCLLRHEKSI